MASYWDEIIDYLKGDDVIKSWLDVPGETEGIKTLTQVTAKEWAQVFAYQGFDVKRIVRLIVQNYNLYTVANVENRLEYKFNIRDGDDEREFTYTNQEKLHKDIQFAITLFCIRGNNIDKINRKSLPELADLIEMMKEKLGIDTERHDANTPLAPEIITLPRMSACFPTIICGLFSDGVAKKLVGPANLGLPAVIDNAVYCPFFTSCIPKSVVTVGARNVNLLFFMVHIIVDDVIHRREKTYTDLADMFAYYRASYDSAVTPDASRILYCKKIGILVPTGNSFIAPIITATEAAEEKIRSLRPTDPDLEQVIEDLRGLQA